MLFPHGELLVITAGYVLSLIVGVGFGLFVLAQKNRGPAHVVFFLMCAALGGFQLSFILGSNTPPSQLAYEFWFANLVDIFLTVFYLHFIVLALDVWKKWRNIVIADYAAGLGILAASFLYPALFLPRVIPKLYFLSYLDAGPLYVAMFAFFTISMLTSFTVMLVERRQRSNEGKQRINYYFLSLFYGCATGFTAFALVFDIKLDPMPSVFLGTFVIPMVYGMIKKDLLEIRIVLQRTIIFTVAIAGLTAAFITLPFLSAQISLYIPSAGYWLVPLVAALGAVFAGTLYWRKGQETEKLKYEFVTVAAHKFRTPLTRVRWAADALLQRTDLPPEATDFIKRIKESDLELIQLSNLLMDAARMDREQYTYVQSLISLQPIVEEVLESYGSVAVEKHITLRLVPPTSIIPAIRGDSERLASAMGVLVENAIAYTPSGGTIEVQLSSAPDAVRFEIRDSGIGVSPEEQKHIFKKFYRTERARHADTEGIGLGLNMAKSIIERHRGSIGVESTGVGKGSTFWFTLPVPKAGLTGLTNAK